MLPRVVIGNSEDLTRKTVVDAVKQDENVLFHWNLVSQDIDEEESSLELLSEITDLWITIRGFSLASHWLEAYKLANKTLVKKSTGIRKTLS